MNMQEYFGAAFHAVQVTQMYREYEVSVASFYSLQTYNTENFQLV